MSNLELLRIVAVLSFAAMFIGIALTVAGRYRLGATLVGVGATTFIVVAIGFSEAFSA